MYMYVRLTRIAISFTMCGIVVIAFCRMGVSAYSGALLSSLISETRELAVSIKIGTVTIHIATSIIII